MKLTLLTPALAAILGLALASAPVTTQAQTTAAPAAAPAAAAAPKAPKASKAKTTSYEGTLTTIAADSSSVVVTSSKKTLTLAIDPKTSYLKDKKAATLADFAVGDKVTGSFTTDATGALTAHSLHKSTAAKKTAKAKTTAAPAAATPATAAPAAAPAPAPAPAAAPATN